MDEERWYDGLSEQGQIEFQSMVRRAAAGGSGLPESVFAGWGRDECIMIFKSKFTPAQKQVVYEAYARYIMSPEQGTPQAAAAGTTPSSGVHPDPAPAAPTHPAETFRRLQEEAKRLDAKDAATRTMLPSTPPQPAAAPSPAAGPAPPKPKSMTNEEIAARAAEAALNTPEIRELIGLVKDTRKETLEGESVGSDVKNARGASQSLQALRMRYLLEYNSLKIEAIYEMTGALFDMFHVGFTLDQPPEGTPPAALKVRRRIADDFDRVRKKLAALDRKADALTKQESQEVVV